MKIIVEYDAVTGYISDKMGSIWMTAPGLQNFEEYNEDKDKEVRKEAKLTVKDIIKLKRAGVI